MELYAMVDEDLQVAKHRSKGTLAVFKDLEMLKKHAWRYKKSGKSYKIAELEPINFFSFEEAEGYPRFYTEIHIKYCPMCGRSLGE